MKFKLKKTLATLVATALLSTSIGVQAAGPDKISLNFVNANVSEVIKAVAHITKRNFVVDPRVQGTVNIVSTDPVAAPVAYDILLSALRLQGFTTVESDGVTKIMPEADAKLHLADADEYRGRNDRLVTRVYKLKYESAVQVVPILRPIIAPNNVVTAYPNGNMLVVTDYASNLKRIEQIVNSIDRPSSDDPLLIPVQHMSAMDLAQTINHLMTDNSAAAAQAGSGSRFVLTADSRTNSLLLRTDNPSQLQRVQDLVARLDVQTSEPGNIHVVYLKNAEARKMAETLRAVLSGDTSMPSNNSKVTSRPAGAAAPAAGNASSTPASSPSSNAISGGGMIQADVASNALIITAPDAVYNNLRAVIDKLDVRRAQVFVEALVVEVTAKKAAEFGVQWQDLAAVNRGGANFVGGTNFGGTGANIISAATGLSSLGNGLNIGVVRGTTELPGVGRVVNLAMLARALETDSNANILSTPNLLTLDNEEAQIVIGQNVPFVTGSYAQTGGNNNTASPFQTIERKDVGLTLRIKPQVSEGGTVRLEIYQEVSSVESQSVNNNAGLITNKRSLESMVLADEGQIVVLGGLIQDSVADGEDKVPLLGNIPILGNLFRYEKRERAKTNLMVFIRPQVLRSAASSTSLTQDRYDYLNGEQQARQLPAKGMLPAFSTPSIESFNPKASKAP